MSNYPTYLQNKAEMKYDAATAKPEKPRFGDEATLNNLLFNMQQQYSAPDRQVDAQMFDELGENWNSGGGGNRGDALISGLKAGLKKGSFLGDKERLGKIMQFTEQMQGMVHQQNRELHKQETLHNAKQKFMPEVHQLLQDPKISYSDYVLRLHDIGRRLGKIIGQNVDVVSSDPNNRANVTMLIDDEPQVGNLLDIFGTPEMMQYKLLENSSETRQAESLLKKSDELDRQYKQSQINKNNAKAGIYNNGETILQTEHGDLDISAMPTIQTAKERNMYSETYSGMAKVVRELTDTLSEVNDLEKLTEGNIFSPVGSQAGEFPNKVKDWVAKNPNWDKGIEKEVELRNRVESRFQQLQPVLERYLKKSAPDAQLLTRMHEKGVYPETNQSFNVIKSKIEMLLNTAKEDMNIAGLSLKTGRQIPFLPKGDNGISSQPKNNTAQITPQQQALVNRKNELLQRRQQIMQRKGIQ